MLKKYFIIAFFIVAPGVWASAQDPTKDTVPSAIENSMAMDSMDLDDLLSDFELFLDSILAPKSYFLANLSLSQGYFTFHKRTAPRIQQIRKFIWSPNIGYYSKSGLGIAVTGFAVNDSANLNLYQFSISGSYDYIKSKDLATGISFTRYFTKDSLRFYSSPLKNEVNFYFLWRKSWIQPSITAGYGWGSRTQYEKIQKTYRQLLKDGLASLVNNPGDTLTIIKKNQESITDFSISAAVRHNFYWLNIFSKKDYIRLTPVISVSGGTQKFGFNHTSANDGVATRIANVLFGSRNLTLKQEFKLLSLTMDLRGEYSINKFFIQPQMIFDYYFPAKKNNFNTLFSLNVGMIL